MGRKSKADQRRREILEHCYQIMGEEGLEGVTLKNIGNQMGVAPSLIMHYFKNKEEILTELVDFLTESMDRAYLPQLDKLNSAKEKLEFYIDKTLHFDVASSVNDQVFYGCFYLSIRNEEIRHRFARMYDHDEKLLKKLIEEYLIECGPVNVDSTILSIQIASIIEGFYFLRMIEGDRKELLDALENTREIIWSLLKSGK